MEDFNPELHFKKHRKLRRILLILLPFMAITALAGMVSSGMFMNITGILFIIFLFTDLGIVIAWFTERFYNWIIFFIILVVISIVFRHQRWPFTGVFLTFGFGGLGSVSLFASVTYLKRFPNNPFLKYFGFISSIVLFVILIGLLWTNMHWDYAGYFVNAGLITYIPFLFAFVFTLPNSNFMNWNKSERLIFYKAIIIPMIFVFAICVVMFVFPDYWTMLNRSSLLPFHMQPIEFLDKPGLH